MHRLTEQLPALLQRLVAHAPASARVLAHWRGGGAAAGWAPQLAAAAAAALLAKPLSALLGGNSGRGDNQRGGLPLTALVALLRGDNQRGPGLLRTVHVARLSDVTADPLAGRVYTCALDEGDVSRAFGDCRDPLGSTLPLGGPGDPLGGSGGEARPLATLPAALAPTEAIEALRACAWSLYAEVPVDLLGPAARLHALLDNLSGKRSVEQVVAEATRVRAPPRFAPSEALPPLFAGENAGARRDAVRVWGRLELRSLPGFPLWEEELFGLVCTWHHHLRAIYDAYATPLRPRPKGDRSSSASSSELLPRGARVLPPAAWLALCCGCGLDASLPLPLLAEALQQAVRDVAPRNEAGVVDPSACEPADYVGFVQALISLSHAWAMSPRTNAAGTASTAAAAGTEAGTEVLPRCFGALMLEALTPHARQAQPREFRRRMGHEAALVTPPVDGAEGAVLMVPQLKWCCHHSLPLPWPRV